jgi:transcriptional antiterminator NusG
MGIARMDVDKDLTPGTKVNIIDGPFKGMFGKVDSLDLENSKVNLMVDLFGQETSVEVELSQIQKI